MCWAVPRPSVPSVVAANGLINGPASVVAHYGSPAGELAACVRGAGLVDRSDLLAIEIAGESLALAELVERASGWSLAPGGCSFAAGTWWCARSSACVIALVEWESRETVETIAGLGGPDLCVSERSQDLAAIGLVGKATLDVLSAVGAVRDPRAAPAFGGANVGGADVELLLQSDRRAVLLVRPEAARHVWRTVEAAGRPFGLCYVGAEAHARFTLMERMLARTAPAPGS
jgi:glycine cleavage system aminomethyltransferase T